MVNSNNIKKFILLFIAVFSIAIFIAIPTIVYADAETSGTYGTKDTNDLWYFGEDYLDLENAKSIVSTWNPELLNKIGTIYIGVIDTGINTSHEIFSDTLALDKSGNISGYNAYAATTNIGQKTDISDTTQYHGTMVAGIIAMLIKEFQLQDHIKIYPIKANTPPTGTDGKASFSIASIITSLNWAVSDGIDVDVINLSLGLLNSTNSDWSTSKDLQYAINNAAKSATVVAAAGNDAKDSKDDTFYPAGLDGIIAVMGYGQDGNIYSTSNYGKAYDIVAPGSGIYTAKAAKTGYVSNESGTSMASAFVSFGAALLKLRMLYEGKDEASLNGNTIARMMLSVDGNKIEKSSYEFNSIDYVGILSKQFDQSVYDYLNPTGIYLSYPTDYYDAELQSFYMIANEIQELSLSASVLPFGQTNPDLDDVIMWYIVDGYSQEQLIGQGSSIKYAPNKGGDYKIIIRLKYDQTTYSDEVAWKIDFIPFYAADARVTYQKNYADEMEEAPTGGITYTKDSIALTLTGIQYVDTSSGIKWYVNGEYVADGEVFNFSTNKKGIYNISAEFLDININGNYSFNIEVRPRIEKPIFLSILCVCLAIVLLGVIVLIILYTKRQKLKKPLNDSLMKENYEVGKQ